MHQSRRGQLGQKSADFGARRGIGEGRQRHAPTDCIPRTRSRGVGRSPVSHQPAPRPAQSMPAVTVECVHRVLAALREPPWSARSSRRRTRCSALARRGDLLGAAAARRQQHASPSRGHARTGAACPACPSTSSSLQEPCTVSVWPMLIRPRRASGGRERLPSRARRAVAPPRCSWAPPGVEPAAARRNSSCAAAAGSSGISRCSTPRPIRRRLRESASLRLAGSAPSARARRAAAGLLISRTRAAGA